MEVTSRLEAEGLSRLFTASSWLLRQRNTAPLLNKSHFDSGRVPVFCTVTLTVYRSVLSACSSLLVTKWIRSADWRRRHNSDGSNCLRSIDQSPLTNSLDWVVPLCFTEIHKAVCDGDFYRNEYLKILGANGEPRRAHKCSFVFRLLSPCFWRISLSPHGACFHIDVVFFFSYLLLFVQTPISLPRPLCCQYNRTGRDGRAHYRQCLSFVLSDIASR